MSNFGISHLPSTVVVMLANVLDEAWMDLTKNQDARVRSGVITRNQVAERIMQSALLGERNPVRLKAYAMKIV